MSKIIPIGILIIVGVVVACAVGERYGWIEPVKPLIDVRGGTAAPGAPAVPAPSGTQSEDPRCRRVTDAVKVHNAKCRAKPGYAQYRWRGRDDWCALERQPPGTYFCYNSETGHLAWAEYLGRR